MKCKICGHADGTVYQAREMMMGLQDVFKYFECNNCECLQIVQMPANISKYYPEQYYSLRKQESENFIKRFIKRQRNKYAIFNQSLVGKWLYSKYPKESLRALSYIDSNKEMNILDVGCGTGSLLRALYHLGFKNLTGIDPFIEEDEIAIGENANIYKKEIYDLNASWDLIIMNHSFEHMPEPLKVLKGVSRFLAPGGNCLIRIPVAASKAWEQFRTDWVQLDCPRHFFIHSTESMAYLLKDTDLQLARIVYDSTSFQFWGSIQYQHDIPLQSKQSYEVNPQQSMFTSADIRSFSKKAKKLNNKQEGDQALFVLEKTAL